MFPFIVKLILLQSWVTWTHLQTALSLSLQRPCGVLQGLGEAWLDHQSSAPPEKEQGRRWSQTCPLTSPSSGIIVFQPPGMLESLWSRLGGLPLASSGSWAGMLLTHPTMHKTAPHCKESNVSSAEGNGGTRRGWPWGT